jgi:putative SOS response-associated peptidase YedK
VSILCATFQLSADDVEDIENIANEITKKHGSETAEQCFNKDYYPKSDVPIVGAQNKVTLLRWGFPFKDSSKVVFNARAVGLQVKSMFKTCLNNRCLVPATAFYEYDSSKKKHRISIREQIFFYMAALWKGFVDLNGNKAYHFTIITTEPNEQIKQIHSRMPAIISTNDCQTWLYDSIEALKLLKPLQKTMEVSLVSH